LGGYEEGYSKVIDMETEIGLEVRRKSHVGRLIFIGAFVALLAFVLLMMGGNAKADTVKQGVINADETWTLPESPIWVEGDIDIQNGAHVTIDPGVEVRFNGSYYLAIMDGALIADGDVTAGIVFTSNDTVAPAPGDWLTIAFVGDDGFSFLDEVEIYYSVDAVTFSGSAVPITNSIIDLTAQMGIYVYNVPVPDYNVFISNCIINNTFIPIYIEPLTNTNLTLTVLNSVFSNYLVSGIFFQGLNTANFQILVDGNSFNNSNQAVFFNSQATGDPAAGNIFSFIFTNNWLNSSLDTYGLYFNSIQNFAVTTITIDDNYFWGQNSRGYGAYFMTIRGNNNYYHNLTFSISGNEFIDLDQNGVIVTGSIYWFRHVSIGINGNTFLNPGGLMDYGVYFGGAIYFDNDLNDTSFTLNINGNTAEDLLNDVVRFASTISGFRNMSITIDLNNFRNTANAWTDYGVYFEDTPFYNSVDYDNNFILNIQGNTMQDLVNAGVHFDCCSVLDEFRHVTINVQGNTFNNTFSTWMDYGVFMYYTPQYNSNDYMSTFDFTFTNNVANDLLVDVFSFNTGSVVGFRDVTITVSWNVIYNVMSNYIDSAVRFPSTIYFGTSIWDTSFTMSIHNNTFSDLDAYPVLYSHIYRFNYVSIDFSDNVFQNTISSWMDWAIYFNDLYYDNNDNDTSLTININRNTIVDILNDAVRFNSASYYGFRNVTINLDGNTFNNTANAWMNYGVYFNEPFLYTSDSYDTNFILRVEGNTMQDLELSAFYIDCCTVSDGFRHYTIIVRGNTLNNTFSNWIDYGFYSYYPPRFDADNYDSTFDLIIESNIVNDIQNHFFRFGTGSIDGYRNITITITWNIIYNTASNLVDYGVYFPSSIYFSGAQYENFFALQIHNNSVSNLNNDAVRFESTIYGFRHLSIDINDNIFNNTITSWMDYGVYFANDLYYSGTQYDTSFMLNINGNTAMDLVGDPIRFNNDIYGFRNITIAINYNFFRNTISTWMNYGVYFADEPYYDSVDYDNNFILIVEGNTMQDLEYSGVYFDSGDVPDEFRHFTIIVKDNIFNNTISNWMDYGFYMYYPPRYNTNIYASTFDLTIVNNTAHDLSNDLFRFGTGNIHYFRDVTITISWNTVFNIVSNYLDYAVYITGTIYYNAYQYDSSFTLDVNNNSISDLNDHAIRFGTIYGFRHFSIDINDNVFDNTISSWMDYGMYFGGSIYYTTTYDSDFQMTVLSNQIKDLSNYGIRFAGSIYDFRNVTILIDNNEFNDTISNWMETGIYFESIYYNSNIYDNMLDLDITNNKFYNLNDYGIRINQIYGFRTVNIDILYNTFDDIYNSFSHGIYFSSTIYYTTSYDSSFTFNILNNDFYNLNDRGIYFANHIYNFRDVTILIDNNEFNNTIFNWMNYGIYFNQIYYQSNAFDNIFDLDITNNEFYNLDSEGIRFSSIYGFRTVNIDILYNTFNDVFNSFSYGIYFSSSIYYSTSFPGTFTLDVMYNDFSNLTSRAIYFSQIYNFLKASVDVQWNSFDYCGYGFYMNNIGSADDLDFIFSNNTGSNLNNYMLRGGYFYGNSIAKSKANFILTDNTATNSYGGLYVGSIDDFDLSGGMLFEDNTFTDMMDWGIGIELGWHYMTNSHVIIQNNIITGPAWAAIYMDGFEYQTAIVDIQYNDIQGAMTGIWIDYPSYESGSTTLNIMHNDLTGITEYGIYFYEVYESASFINIQDNVIAGDPLAYFSVSLIYFEEDNWRRAFADISIRDNTLDNGLHGIYFGGTYGYGATVLMDIDNVTVTNVFFDIYLDYPAGHAADLMSIRISNSDFIDSGRGFLCMNNPGYGMLLVDIRYVNVIDFGGLGGYAFFMGDNDGGYIQIDVRNTEFVAAPGSLGDVFAGSGPITINFYYIDSISTGISNDVGQKIRVLWKVDVQVLIGSGFNVSAPAGIIVYSNDQYGFLDFYIVTDANGQVIGQWISGLIITNDGTSPYTGPAIHTFTAQIGPYTGTALATFNANGTVTILLPGDDDADGFHNGVDTDDDGDGVADIFDDFPLDPNESRDTDGDRIGDNSDSDIDGDGVPNEFDVFPYTSTEYYDTDGDGIGDNTDWDIDGDGVANANDGWPYDATKTAFPAAVTGAVDYTGILIVIAVLLVIVLLIIVALVMRRGGGLVPPTEEEAPEPGAEEEAVEEGVRAEEEIGEVLGEEEKEF